MQTSFTSDQQENFWGQTIPKCFTPVLPPQVTGRQHWKVTMAITDMTLELEIMCNEFEDLCKKKKKWLKEHD